MTIKERYFKWLYNKITDKGYFENETYINLCKILHDIEFIFVLPMDDNRASDGEDLRYKFAYEEHVSENLVARELDRYPASVFEVLVALALRIEGIMEDSDIPQTPVWFFKMCKNIGILYPDRITDEDVQAIQYSIDVWMDRKFRPDGRGSIFLRPESRKDIDYRTVEFWYQAMWYLSDKFYKEE